MAKYVGKRIVPKNKYLMGLDRSAESTEKRLQFMRIIRKRWLDKKHCLPTYLRFCLG